MIWRAIYISACSLALAGIVHIAIVLLVPTVGTRDAYALLSKQTEPFAFRVVDPEKGEGIVTDIDPFFSYGVCRFEMGLTGVSLKGPDKGMLWSATLVDQDGGVVYSLNNRTAIEGRLDLIVLDPLLILRLRESQPPDIENAIVVETPMKAGFVVLRVFRPDATWTAQAAEFMEGVQCRAYEPPAAAPAEPAGANPGS